MSEAPSAPATTEVRIIDPSRRDVLVAGVGFAMASGWFTPACALPLIHRRST